MKRILSIAIILVFLTSFCGCAFAETTDDSSVSDVLAEIIELIKSVPPEDQKLLQQSIFWYMVLSSSEDSVNNDVTSTSDDVSNISETTSYVEFPIIFENENFEAYITAWESCNFYDGDIGYEFSVTVYNNSDTYYEFGVKDLKVNGWNIQDSGFYTSIATLQAGEKTRETWQISALVKKAGLTSLDEVEEINGLFFIKEPNKWDAEKITQNITITKADLDQILCKD